MIRVERNQVDEAGQPIRPNDDWFTTAAEKTVEAEAEQGDHEVTDHYKDVQIKIALEKLFNFKCAYCERDLSPPWDVEHFRPKGRVAERREHPGYYWLAYEWTNLYPSCQNCNQRRKDQPVWGNADLTPGPAAGKLDQFPWWSKRTEPWITRWISPRKSLCCWTPATIRPKRSSPLILRERPSVWMITLAACVRSRSTI